MASVAFAFNAEIVNVHDGDTINCLIDRGMYDYAGSYEHPVPVRILGINAAELGTSAGDAAAMNLSELLPPGAKVVLRTVKPDKFAPRWLASVEADGITDLASLLIGQQWAAPWNGTGTKPLPPWPRTI